MSLLQVVPYCEFLRWLPAFLVDRLDQMSQTRIYPAGEMLFAEGSEHPDFHILVEGHVQLDMMVEGHGRLPILQTQQGDILAWSSLLDKKKMTSSGVAIDDVKTVAIPGHELQHLCETDHELGYHVMRQLSAALAKRLVATRVLLLDHYTDRVAKPRVIGRPGDEQC